MEKYDIDFDAMTKVIGTDGDVAVSEVIIKHKLLRLV